MKILVTGASGFIGSFMVEEALRRGMDTWAGVRASSSRAYLRDSRIRFAELDLGRADVLEKQLLRQRDEAGPWDYVIHCAGATKCRRTEDFDRINYEGTCHLVRLLASTGMMPRQFIFISSLSVYGPVHEQDYAPISDHDTPRPDTAYGKSKLRAEQFLQASPADFPYVIFRPTGVYGPRERDYFLMAKSIDRHVDVAVGFRRQDLTFVFVKDLVQAVFRAIDRGVTRRAYFVSDGNVYASRTFSDYIQRELGRHAVAHLTLPLGLVRCVSAMAETVAGWAGRSSTLNRDKYNIMKQRNWRCDIRPLVDELGYQPEYDLERGVRESIAWYKKEGWL
ncbi:MAG TPA: NAD-dependent dehydratase [Bacteroides sp.]|nr:NAD(P)-dependent oxidoreductase [Phocaeicola coprophilus]HBB06926.1 NAD-dependent dehydratase [Bacteroides sp.]